MSIKYQRHNIITISCRQIVLASLQYDALQNKIISNNSIIINNEIIGCPVKIFYSEPLASPIILTDATKLYTINADIITMHPYANILDNYCQPEIISINIDSMLFKSDNKFFAYHNSILFNINNCASGLQNDSHKSHIVIYIDVNNSLIIHDLITDMMCVIDCDVTSIVGHRFYENALNEQIIEILYQKRHKMLFCTYVYEQSHGTFINIKNRCDLIVHTDVIYIGVFFNHNKCYAVGSDGILYMFLFKYIYSDRTHSLDITNYASDHIFINGRSKSNMLFLQTSNSEIILFNTNDSVFVEFVLEACQFNAIRSVTKSAASFM
jgi:hypothetical protein